MGVPKFYRWLSERYPQINQMLSDTSLLPEFDNFYLDMNGIIHACTHPNDNGTSSSLSLREMMLAIFRYIDRMVTEIVKPKKILFMAIDGCAPRAKLNQQRARRFRAAQDRTDAINKMKQRGDTVDESSLFDSNCITPGTEFMDTVSKHIKWFIRKKIKEDPLWRNLEIVFSGHDVPGEGEHKIMQFIREMKARPDYAPNQRHCMYGQDADLIMLGLASHEPHFSLLREVVEFSSKFKGSVRQTVIRQTKEVQFQLLHLSVLREYIQVDLGLGIEWGVDPERLYEDFILLTFLVGNDFLPHLPTLDISEHAFDVIFDAYKDVLREKRGYISKNGEIDDISALEKLFTIIGEQEREILKNRETESMAYLAKRRKWAEEEMPTEEEIEEAEEAQRQAYEDAIQEALGNGGSSGEVQYAGEKDHRGLYYFEKFKIVTRSAKSKDFFEQLKASYLEGLMWCLAYYIKGCVSWTWYYPYHYGPMLQDMKNLTPIMANIKFELGQPFLPYQQLLGCLPPASKSLLPRPYQWLMTNEASPMLSDYPEEFGIDMDGKKNPWEAVVLLGFIDEKRLFEAEAKHCKTEMLTEDELARNKFGVVLAHRYDPKVFTTYFSCNPEIGLPDITKCQSEVTFSVPDLKPGASFKPELVPGTITPIAGFPSLTVLQISKVDIDFYKTNVFGTESKYRTLVLEIFSQNIDIEKVDLKTLLGRLVYVNYPMMHEAKVVGITTSAGEYRLINNDEEVSYMKYDLASSELWKKEAVLESLKYLKGRTTPGSSGLDIGDIQIRLRVQALQGMKRDPLTGASKKIYNTTEADVPIQLALWTATTIDTRFQEQDEVPVEKLMPYGCSVAAVVGPLRGCLGTVTGPHTAEDSKKMTTKDSASNSKRRVVDVEFSIPPAEPPFGHLIADSIKDEYYPSQDVCNALKVPPNVLGKIVGSIIVDKEDIGLNLKRNGHFQLLGYVRRVDSEGEQSWGAKDTVVIIGTVVGSAEEEEVTSSLWQYSAKAIALIVDFKTKFPAIFDKLRTLPHQKKYSSTDIFGSNSATMVGKVLEWMKTQPFYNLPRTPFTTSSLSKEAMNAIERAEDMRVSFVASSGVVKKVVKDVSIDSLYRGDVSSPSDAALTYNAGRPQLGDRVVNLNSIGVPFGLRGTVVAIHTNTAYVEVIFDEEFTGGRGLQGNCSPFRGRLCPWAALLKVSADRENDNTNNKQKVQSDRKKNSQKDSHIRGQGPEEVNYKNREPNKPGLVSEIGKLIAQKSNIPTGTVTITKLEKPKIKKLKNDTIETKSEEKTKDVASTVIETKDTASSAVSETTNMTAAFKTLFSSMSTNTSTAFPIVIEETKASTNITSLLKDKLKLSDSTEKSAAPATKGDPKLLLKLKKMSEAKEKKSEEEKKSGFGNIKIHSGPYIDPNQESSDMPPPPPVMMATPVVYMPMPYLIPVMVPVDPSSTPLPQPVVRNTLSAARNTNTKPDWEEDDLDLTKELDLEEIKKNNKSDGKIGGSGLSFLKQAAEGAQGNQEK